MGFRCPICSKDFENSKEKFNEHIKKCGGGLAKSFVDEVIIVAERRPKENTTEI